jgi:hypothetical protein
MTASRSLIQAGRSRERIVAAVAVGDSAPTRRHHRAAAGSSSGSGLAAAAVRMWRRSGVVRAARARFAASWDQ